MVVLLVVVLLVSASAAAAAAAAAAAVRRVHAARWRVRRRGVLAVPGSRRPRAHHHSFSGVEGHQTRGGGPVTLW